MRMSFRHAALAAFAALATAMPAQATIFTITWGGKLATGSSLTVNGGMTADIGGTDFTVVYTIDDSLGTDNSTLPDFANVFGGPVFGVATSPVSAVVTLTGFGSYTLTGNDLSEASRVNYAPVSTFPDAASYRSDDQIDEVIGNIDHHRTASVSSFMTETDPAIYGTLFDSVAYDAEPIRDRAASDTSTFFFLWNDIVTDLDTQDTEQLFIEARATDTWIVTQAVPEPASWAMMIGGFALAGGMMRRRRVFAILT